MICLKLLSDAAKEDGYAYTTKVGEENIVFRRRRIEYTYNTDYYPVALPQVKVKFSNFEETEGKTYKDVIPDTGADLTCLPISDCEDIDLFVSPTIRGNTQKSGKAKRDIIFYLAMAEINGLRSLSVIEPVPEKER